MPRFFFDVEDGDVSTRDEEGLELEDLEAAKAEAVRALPDIARDKLPDGDRREFVVGVRDEAGHLVLRATLALTVETLSG